MFSNTNYNLYKAFVAVYEFQSISRAAKEILVAQPNVSRNIKELENQLGVKLFHSNSRGVEPTCVGRALYLKIAPALAYIDYGEKSIKEFNEASEGVIRISIATNFAGHYLVPYISEFNKKYPFVQFEIQNRPVELALEMLGRNRVDLVLSTLGINDKGEFEKLVLAELNEVGIAGKGLALDKEIGNTISEEKLQKLPHISINLVEPRKKPGVIVSSQDMLVKLVKNNLGVGFCSEEFIDAYHSGEFVKFRIENTKMSKWNLNCVYNKNYLSKATEIFLELVRKYQRKVD